LRVKAFCQKSVFVIKFAYSKLLPSDDENRTLKKIECGIVCGYIREKERRKKGKVVTIRTRKDSAGPPACPVLAAPTTPT
jgi:hypothetical protein